MNSESSVVRPSRDAKVLAVLGIVAFWAIPFSPLVAIAALKRTQNANGWARRLSVAAAILCSVSTVAMAAWVLFLTIHVLTSGPSA